MTAPLREDRLAESAGRLRPISRVRIKQGISGGWHVRFRQGGEERQKRGFTTEAKAEAWIDAKIQQAGGAQ